MPYADKEKNAACKKAYAEKNKEALKIRAYARRKEREAPLDSRKTCRGTGS